jgi:DNA-binding transcriptional LysR family regulator
MRTNLDIQVLRTFVLGFELGSFALASEHVGRSQSAISTQLRKLEEQVGQRLVRKAGRGLALTDAGETLLSYARRILDLNDEALESIRGSELEGRVRLGLPQDFAEVWLPEMLGRFARAHPKVRVEVKVEKTSALAELTRRGELDMCLSWGASHGAPHVEPVAQIPVVWVGREDWPGLEAFRDDAIPLIAFEPPCTFRDPAIAALDRAEIAWRIAFSSPSLAGLWAAASAGLGITMRTAIGLPLGLVALDPHRAGLPELPVAELSLVRAEQHPTGAVSVLQSILLDVIHQRLEQDMPRAGRA